jgi:hypothetical protein
MMETPSRVAIRSGRSGSCDPCRNNCSMMVCEGPGADPVRLDDRLSSSSTAA